VGVAAACLFTESIDIPYTGWAASHDTPFGLASRPRRCTIQ
jgi:hypothetical protein